VVPLVDDPRNGVSLLAPLVLSLDRSRSRLRLGSDRLAPVVAHKSIPHLSAPAHGKDRVGRAVLPVVRDRLRPALAPAQLAAGQDGNGPDDVGAGTSDSVRHCAAVAEASREDEVRVDAELVGDSFDELVEEGNVFAALVAPPVVEPVRHDEDGAVVGQGRQAVIGKDPATIRVLAVDDFLRVAVELVVREDEAVGAVWRVVVRQLHEVLPLLAVHLHSVLLVPQRRHLAAAGRRVGVHGTEQGH